MTVPFARPARLVPLAALLAPAVLAAPQVEDVGSQISNEDGAATLVSRDGRTVAGTSFNRLFRWTESGGYLDLELPPQRTGIIRGISDDGAFVAGHVNEGGDFRAARWNASGQRQPLGSFFTPPGAISDTTIAFDISGDGQTVIGWGTLFVGPGIFEHAFRWTEAGGLVDIHPTTVSASLFSHALDVSVDGSVTIGSVFNPFAPAPRQMFVHLAGAGTFVVDAPGLVEARPLGVSRDGSRIYGFGDFGGPDRELFRWTPAVGVQRLAVLTGGGIPVSVSGDGETVLLLSGEVWTEATGLVTVPGVPFAPRSVSDDGSVILGVGPGGTTLPVLWTADAGVVELERYGQSATGYEVSGDGSTVVGGLFRPDAIARPVRWRLDDSGLGSAFCSPASPHSASPDGGRMEAVGTNIGAFDDLTLRASNLPQNTFGIFIAGREEAAVALQNGTLCVGPAVLRFVGPGQIQNSGAAGSFELPLDREDLRPLLGGVLPPFGETVRFQAWFRDAGLSNLTDAVAVRLH